MELLLCVCVRVCVRVCVYVYIYIELRRGYVAGDSKINPPRERQISSLNIYIYIYIYIYNHKP
jgi:hypothetical protein